jgi:hypothetical protein
MATAKKTGIVAKMKNAIAGMFSGDAERKPPARTAAKKEPGKSAATKAAKKVVTPVKKAAKSARKTVAKKAPAKKAATAKKVPGERKVGAF